MTHSSFIVFSLGLEKSNDDTQKPLADFSKNVNERAKHSTPSVSKIKDEYNERRSSLGDNPFDYVEKIAARQFNPFDFLENEANLKGRRSLLPQVDVKMENLLEINDDSQPHIEDEESSKINQSYLDVLAEAAEFGESLLEDEPSLELVDDSFTSIPNFYKSENQFKEDLEKLNFSFTVNTPPKINVYADKSFQVPSEASVKLEALKANLKSNHNEEKADATVTNILDSLEDLFGGLKIEDHDKRKQADEILNKLKVKLTPQKTQNKIEIGKKEPTLKRQKTFSIELKPDKEEVSLVRPHIQPVVDNKEAKETSPGNLASWRNVFEYPNSINEKNSLSSSEESTAKEDFSPLEGDICSLVQKLADLLKKQHGQSPSQNEGTSNNTTFIVVLNSTDNLDSKESSKTRKSQIFYHACNEWKDISGLDNKALQGEEANSFSKKKDSKSCPLNAEIGILQSLDKSSLDDTSRVSQSFSFQVQHKVEDTPNSIDIVNSKYTGHFESFKNQGLIENVLLQNKSNVLSDSKSKLPQAVSGTHYDEREKMSASRISSNSQGNPDLVSLEKETKEKPAQANKVLSFQSTPFKSQVSKTSRILQRRNSFSFENQDLGNNFSETSDQDKSQKLFCKPVKMKSFPPIPIKHKTAYKTQSIFSSKQPLKATDPVQQITAPNQCLIDKLHDSDLSKNNKSPFSPKKMDQSCIPRCKSLNNSKSTEFLKDPYHSDAPMGQSLLNHSSMSYQIPEVGKTEHLNLLYRNEDFSNKSRSVVGDQGVCSQNYECNVSRSLQ